MGGIRTPLGSSKLSGVKFVPSLCLVYTSGLFNLNHLHRNESDKKNFFHDTDAVYSE